MLSRIIVVAAIERMKMHSAVSMTCVQVPHTTFTITAMYAGKIAASYNTCKLNFTKKTMPLCCQF